MRRLTTSSFGPTKRMRLHRIVRLGNEDGGALYELAFALPVLLALVVGITFGGITFYDYVTLADAVAAGARTLATSRTSASPNPLPCTAAQNVFASSAFNLNQKTLSPLTIKFLGTGTAKSTCTVTVNGVTAGGLIQGDTAVVSATYPCFLKVPVVGFNTIDLCPSKDKNGNDALTSSTTVLIE
jgi:Flp pilus assembly protein TadG